MSLNINYKKQKYTGNVYPEPQDLYNIMCITLSPEEIPNARKITLMDSTIKEYLAEILTHIHYILDDLKYCKLLLNFEMHHRPHFHGWIEITDPAKFYIHDIPLLEDYGHFQIEPEIVKRTNKDIHYTDWSDYITKQSTIWQNLFPALQWVTIPQYYKIKSITKPLDHV